MIDLTPEKRAELRMRIGRARPGYCLTIESTLLLSLLDALDAKDAELAKECVPCLDKWTRIGELELEVQRLNDALDVADREIEEKTR